MLILQDLAYIHPDKERLFDHLQLTIHPREKIALVGNNGAGKSILLKIISGELRPSAGLVKTDAVPYEVPQVFGQYDRLTVAEALRVAGKLTALREILNGRVTAANLALLDEDWGLEERCRQALSHWKLEGLDPALEMGRLSGGEKTRVFLAGIAIHRPAFILLDEPSNHLDAPGRELLYEWIRSTSGTLVVVSHDRTLLNLLDTVCELGDRGLTLYGGDYEFYREQKRIAGHALNEDLKSHEKALRKAREKARETLERQQKLDARGKRKQAREGLPTISMHTFRDMAEKSTARIKGAHTGKIEGLSAEVRALRAGLPDISRMKLSLDPAALHPGKILYSASDINFSYDGRLLWAENLDFQIRSGERIALDGLNGSGKTTLVRIMLGRTEPSTGTLYRAGSRSVYVDQDYSLIDNRLPVYEQAGSFNRAALGEHGIKTRLSRFLFTPEDWDKPCGVLSGGEKMRLMLCCLTMDSRPPDILVLDEPTHNLDMQNLEILTAAVREYAGTLLVVSHDGYFLEQIGVQRTIRLSKKDCPG